MAGISWSGSSNPKRLRSSNLRQDMPRCIITMRDGQQIKSPATLVGVRRGCTVPTVCNLSGPFCCNAGTMRLPISYAARRISEMSLSLTAAFEVCDLSKSVMLDRAQFRSHRRSWFTPIKCSGPVSTLANLGDRFDRCTWWTWRVLPPRPVFPYVDRITIIGRLLYFSPYLAAVECLSRGLPAPHTNRVSYLMVNVNQRWSTHPSLRLLLRQLCQPVPSDRSRRGGRHDRCRDCRRHRRHLCHHRTEP